MKTIKAIQINGFQSHIDTNLQLSQGLNIITGASDSGKSAIIRAIKWAYYNKPTGDAFLNDTEQKAEVSILFEDDTQIVRVRGKSENFYRTFDTLQESGDKLTGFGHDTPQEVQNITRAPAGEFAEQQITLNFASQLDAPFLLSETPGQAARILGKLANTEEIDLAAKDVNGELHRTRQQKNTYELQLEKLDQDIKKYDWLTAAHNVISQGEMRLKLIQSHTENRKALFNVFLRARDNNFGLNVTNQTLTALEQILRLQELLFLIEEKQKLLKRLQGIVNKKISIKMIESALNNRLEVLIKLEDLQVQIDITTEKLSQHKKYDSINSAYKLHELLINNTNKKLKKLSPVGDLAARLKLAESRLNKYFKLFAVNDMENVWRQDRARVQKIIILKSKIDKLNNLLITVNVYKDRLKKFKEITNQRTLLLNRLDIFKNEYTSQSKQIQAYQKDFMEYLQSMKVCPVCFTAITEEKIQLITGG